MRAKEKENQINKSQNSLKRIIACIQIHIVVLISLRILFYFVVNGFAQPFSTSIIITKRADDVAFIFTPKANKIESIT